MPGLYGGSTPAALASRGSHVIGNVGVISVCEGHPASPVCRSRSIIIRCIAGIKGGGGSSCVSDLLWGERGMDRDVSDLLRGREWMQ